MGGRCVGGILRDTLEEDGFGVYSVGTGKGLSQRPYCRDDGDIIVGCDDP